ncbi:hypothetical protein B5X24_HaOG209025 [Helicoverpa armigera]|uniref:Uncharacterized protein n=1 Tax=Helicoverpa armigera TaxID=29058 RepID=A0A2W1BHA5_HELAM|nr:hypothetical protein B5X24_HaOG209025 [Helicoverpa armigera]
MRATWYVVCVRWSALLPARKSRRAARRAAPAAASPSTGDLHETHFYTEEKYVRGNRRILCGTSWPRRCGGGCSASWWARAAARRRPSAARRPAASPAAAAAAARDVTRQPTLSCTKL